MCSKSYAHASNLSRHKNEKHNKKKTAAAAAAATSADLFCRICSKWFVTKIARLKHESTCNVTSASASKTTTANTNQPTSTINNGMMMTTMTSTKSHVC